MKKTETKLITASGGKINPLQYVQHVAVYVLTRWTCDKGDPECSETSSTSHGSTIKREASSLIFQRREAEHTLDAFALTDLDWVYMLWALLINTLGKQSAELLCTVIFFPVTSGDGRAQRPVPTASLVDGAFAGICGTENQAIYREHSSLRSSS